MALGLEALQSTGHQVWRACNCEVAHLGPWCTAIHTEFGFAVKRPQQTGSKVSLPVSLLTVANIECVVMMGSRCSSALHISVVCWQTLVDDAPHTEALFIVQVSNVLFILSCVCYHLSVTHMSLHKCPQACLVGEGHGCPVSLLCLL